MTTRAALAVLILSCGGCTSGELEAGRYECARGQGVEQCPGNFRCGLERYCHYIGDTATAWRCETKDDCEGAYTCGLAKSRDFRECHDPAAKTAFACELSTDCSAGWTCGLDGVCYDRAEKKPHRCGAPPSDAFCSPGWRCGLEGTCHDTAVARDYLCLIDLDCEKPWRCGLEGRCLDPSSDALQAPTFTLGSALWMNPLYLQRRPSLLAVSEPFGAGLDQQSIAFVDQGRLVYIERILGEVPLGVGALRLADAGFISPPQAIAAVGRRLFASTATTLIEYAFEPDGSINVLPRESAACAALSYNYQPVAHRYLRNTSGVQGVIAFSDSQDAGYSVLVPQGCNVNLEVYYDSPEGIPSATYDMAAVLPFNSDGGFPDNECYLMSNANGLWVSNFDNVGGVAHGFVPIDTPFFPNLACGVAPNRQLLELKVSGSEFLVVRSRPVDGGTTDAVSVASLAALLSSGQYPCYTGRACRNFPLATPLQIDPVLGPCDVCLGTRVLKFAAVPDLPRTSPAVEVRCEAVPDAGVPSQTYLVRGFAGGCSTTLLPGIGTLLIDDVIPALASQSGVAYAGSRGQIWTGTSSLQAPPLTLDRPPDCLAELRLAVETSARAVAISPGYLAMHEPGVGYVGFLPVSPDRIVGAIDGAPRLAFTNRKAVLDLDGLDPSKGPRTIGFSQDSSPFDPPYTGAVTSVTDAGAHLFVVADDRVYTAALNFKSTTPAPLRSRGAAVPGVTVSSLAAVPIGSGSGLGAAWILAGQRVVYVVSSENNWQRTELPVPMVAGAFPMEVWADGARGRLGYTDGTVFSLPSRVQIGSKVPTQQQRVVDFVAACGQAFALAPEGLFRLTSTAGANIGTWAAVATGTLAANGFEGGRVHAIGSDLHLFNAFGESVRLPIGPCP